MSETQPIRVLIADDQELVRAGFAMVIDSQDDMEVVGQASNGDEAVSLSLDLKPDVVLMDVRMPGTDGIEATKLIIDAERETGNEATKTHVIILTTFDLDEYVMSAIDAGASGFLLKDTEPETLLSSIRTVYQGNAIIAPSATKRLIEKMVDGELGATRATAKSSGGVINAGNARNAGNFNTAENAQNNENLNNDSFHHNGSISNANNADYSNTITGSNTASSADNDNSNVQVPQQTADNAPLPYHDPAVDTLTDREREVLVEIAHGLSNQEIADKLCISLPTVKTHVAHILQKTYSRDRVQAVVFAYDNKLV
ncbi:response regulator transcription factor [Bifidobacterium sp. ESL0745]|uniref:response regulator transcription factor n=1 Tax=Bifidobacterium sp. ESL0745 TaxID=2983226 RepID=UPI0023F9F11B|nr:response regulator transcription factor [Bifidobacterium sp. ESL0745]MDF7665272.1 response regulator transcription factor [Bifidobacterium sp. ESL0745]